MKADVQTFSILISSSEGCHSGHLDHGRQTAQFDPKRPPTGTASRL